MTMYEYCVRMKAHRLQQVDHEYMLHLDHAIHYAGFIDLSFRTDSVTYLHDIPNRYKAGEVLTVDGPSAKMYINGIPSLNDEAVGSKYFKAPPGETKVELYYSDFSDPAPTITAKIREAYL